MTSPLEIVNGLEVINKQREDITPESDSVGALSQVGLTGLEHSGGIVTEEFHPKLRADQGMRVWQEMTDNDPIVGAILKAIDLLIRQVTWTTKAASDSPEDQANAQFIDECMDDMSVSWHDNISEILSMLPYGWSYHELVYKIRRGPDQENPSLRSKYTDGRVGWRKMEIRAQPTRDRWVFDEDDNSLVGMWQTSPPDYKRNFIPIEKALLFRTTTHKANPEGKSVLRNAYRPWVLKKRFEEVEGVGIERDLAGLPIAYVDPAILKDSATDEEKAILAAIKKIVRNIRRDQQEGIIWPQVYDERGNKLYDLQLLNSGGMRQFDVGVIIDRYDRRMAQSVLADFIMLGHESVGSFALSSSKTRLFAVALGAWLDAIGSVLNRHAIPRLFELNNINPDALPEIVHDDLEIPDLAELADFMAKLSGIGIVFDDDESERHLRRIAKLPMPRRLDSDEQEDELEAAEESRVEPVTDTGE